MIGPDNIHTKLRQNLSLSAGFTVIELLIAIIVIGVLATVTIVMYPNASRHTRASALESEIVQIGTKIREHAVYNDVYPESLDEVDVVLSGDKEYIYEHTPTTFCVSVSSEDIHFYVTHDHHTSQVGICD